MPRYEVTAAARHGVLLVGDGDDAVRTFTQADVDAGRVRYRHRDVSADTDYFRFRVGHVGGLESVEREFAVAVESPVMAVRAANLTVIEGQATFVDASTLTLVGQRGPAADVVFSVLTQPSHGRLEAADRPGVRLTQFSGDQLQGSVAFVRPSCVSL